MLTAHFIKLYEQQLGISAAPIPLAVMNVLKQQRWEGNIRQLSNVIRRWCLFGEHSDERDVAAWIEQPQKSIPSPELQDKTSSDVVFMHGTFREGTFDELDTIKTRLIREVLQKYNGNKTKAARHLGISYPGLLKMLKAMNGNSEI
jgi:transcriptional regulator with AAA-type ATPase domain